MATINKKKEKRIMSTQKKATSRKYQKRLYHSKPDHCIKTNFRNCLRQALKKDFDSYVFDYIGLDRDELKCHLKAQAYIRGYLDFSTDFNQSQYHIDHIIPLMCFDFTKENDIFEAYHWTNLQILSDVENFAKGRHEVKIYNKVKGR